MLLPQIEDRDIWAYFASLGFPREEQVRETLAALAESDRPMSTATLETRVELGRNRLESMLKVLDVDGAVQRVQGGWVATGRSWDYDAERYARVAEAREREQQAMLGYLRTDECRMRYLREQLDDPDATDCGRCDNCGGLDPLDRRQRGRGRRGGRAALAARRRRRAAPDVADRARQPRPRPQGQDRRGRRARARGRPAHRPRPRPGAARALPRGHPRRPGAARPRAGGDGGDEGLGARVGVAPRRDRGRRVRDPADPDPRPRRRPVARHAGPGRRHLGDPRPLRAAAGRPVQLGPARRRRTRRRGGLDAEVPAGATVLLVDDQVATGWTLTVAATAIREAGASAVLPLVLATQG